MADDQGGGAWSKVFDRLQSPWDWVAMGVGALGGVAVSIGVGGTDLGSSAAAGAIAGVTAKASAESLLERGRLRKNLEAFRKSVEASIDNHPDAGELHILAAQLETNNRLWGERLISTQKFTSELDALIEQYRSILVARSVPQGLPPPTSPTPQKSKRPRAGRRLSP